MNDDVGNVPEGRPTPRPCSSVDDVSLTDDEVLELLAVILSSRRDATSLESTGGNVNNTRTAGICFSTELSMLVNCLLERRHSDAVMECDAPSIARVRGATEFAKKALSALLVTDSRFVVLPAALLDQTITGALSTSQRFSVVVPCFAEASNVVGSGACDVIDDEYPSEDDADDVKCNEILCGCDYVVIRDRGASDRDNSADEFLVDIIAAAKNYVFKSDASKSQSELPFLRWHSSSRGGNELDDGTVSHSLTCIINPAIFYAKLHSLLLEASGGKQDDEVDAPSMAEASYPFPKVSVRCSRRSAMRFFRSRGVCHKKPLLLFEETYGWTSGRDKNGRLRDCLTLTDGSTDVPPTAASSKSHRDLVKGLVEGVACHAPREGEVSLTDIKQALLEALQLVIRFEQQQAAKGA